MRRQRQRKAAAAEAAWSAEQGSAKMRVVLDEDGHIVSPLLTQQADELEALYSKRLASLVVQGIEALTELGERGLVAYEAGELEMARECFVTQYLLAREIKALKRVETDDVEADSLNLAGLTFYHLGDSATAARLFSTAYEKMTALADERGAAVAMGNRGMALARCGELAAAEEAQREALQLATAAREHELQAAAAPRTQCHPCALPLTHPGSLRRSRCTRSAGSALYSCVAGSCTPRAARSWKPLATP